jgi:FtsZ-interacting cell division protein YlmF
LFLVFRAAILVRPNDYRRCAAVKTKIKEEESVTVDFSLGEK